MNFTESFEQFSSKLTGTDLALYAGVGIVLWILFKDKLSPVQALVLSAVNKAKSLLGNNKTNAVSVVVPPVKSVEVSSAKEDLFFKLVVSWKQTRDLAVQSGCTEAVKVADEMFPHLSPTVCGKEVT
jgi:hypothetical protein